MGVLEAWPYIVGTATITSAAFAAQRFLTERQGPRLILHLSNIDKLSQRLYKVLPEADSNHVFALPLWVWNDSKSKVAMSYRVNVYVPQIVAVAPKSNVVQGRLLSPGPQATVEGHSYIECSDTFSDAVQPKSDSFIATLVLLNPPQGRARDATLRWRIVHGAHTFPRKGYGTLRVVFDT